MGRVVVMIDDIRCFDPDVDAAYPSLDYLVDWARSHGFSWHIEHDIFVAKRSTAPADPEQAHRSIGPRPPVAG
jgi:hypothetical protein